MRQDAEKQIKTAQGWYKEDQDRQIHIERKKIEAGQLAHLSTIHW